MSPLSQTPLVVPVIGDAGPTYLPKFDALFARANASRVNVVNVLHYGAVGNGVTDDTVAIQAAMNAAGSGDWVYFPKPSVRYLVSNALAVNSSGMRLFGASLTTTIRQATWGYPVFDLNQVNDVLVEQFNLEYKGVRTGFSTGDTLRGDNRCQYTAGVYVAGNRNRIRDLRVYGFYTGVAVFSWDGVSQNNIHHESNEVSNIEVSVVDFGVLAYGQSKMLITHIKGDIVPTPTFNNPPHLVYTLKLLDSIVSDCYGYGMTDAHAYQMASCLRCTFKNLRSKDCGGILSVKTECNDNLFDGFMSMGTLGIAALTGKAIYLQPGAGSRNRFVNGEIQMVASGRCIDVRGEDNIFENVRVLTTWASASDEYDICVMGNRNTLRDVTVLAQGAGGARAIGLFEGTGHVLQGIQTKGAKNVVTIHAGVTNCSIDYNPALQPGAADAPGNVMMIHPLEPTALTRANQRLASTAVAGVLGRCDPTRYSHWQISAGDATAFTVHPHGQFKEQDLTVEIRNTSAAPLGAITWSTAWKLAGAFVSPAAGKSRSVQFRSNGTHFIETGRTAADA